MMNDMSPLIRRRARPPVLGVLACLGICLLAAGGAMAQPATLGFEPDSSVFVAVLAVEAVADHLHLRERRGPAVVPENGHLERRGWRRRLRRSFRGLVHARGSTYLYGRLDLRGLDRCRHFHGRSRLRGRRRLS